MGKGMGAICPFSNSISGTSVTMRNHLCHSSWHCLTVPNFSCNTRTQRVTAQKKGMSGALQTLDLLVIGTLVLYFYFKKSFWKSNEHQLNSKPDQTEPQNEI